MLLITHISPQLSEIRARTTLVRAARSVYVYSLWFKCDLVSNNSTVDEAFHFEVFVRLLLLRRTPHLHHIPLLRRTHICTIYHYSGTPHICTLYHYSGAPHICTIHPDIPSFGFSITFIIYACSLHSYACHMQQVHGNLIESQPAENSSEFYVSWSFMTVFV